MRTMAIIENGLIKNIIVIPDGTMGDKEISKRNGVETTNTLVKIGWAYDGEKFTAPELTQAELQAVTEQQDREATRQSALDKLAALGLTPDEISAITGA